MSDTVPTLVVPAELYDSALAFCNARLAEQGRPAITELPAGEPDGQSCPCARAAGLEVDYECWSELDGDRHGEHHITDFVQFFDEHAAHPGLTLPIRGPAPAAQAAQGEQGE